MARLFLKLKHCAHRRRARIFLAVDFYVNSFHLILNYRRPTLLPDARYYAPTEVVLPGYTSGSPAFSSLIEYVASSPAGEVSSSVVITKLPDM